MLFPIFLLLTWKLGKKWIVGFLVFVAIISLAVAQWGASHSPAAAFYLLPTRGWELLTGVFIAFYFSAGKYGASEVTTANAACQIGSILGLLLIAYGIFAFNESMPFPGINALVPTAGTVLVILFANPQTFAGRFLGNKFLVGIGLISYSAYLWHQPLFAYARHNNLAEPSGYVLLGLLVFTFALAYFSWRFVEQPFRNRSAVSTAGIFSLALVGTVAFAALGTVGHVNDGFENRAFVANVKLAAMLDDATLEIRILARTDECHYNDYSRRGIDYFLKNWNCRTDPSDPKLKSIPLIVTGDSHSADVVVALKQNGVVPLQIAGANCSWIPRYMSPDCVRIFDRLYTEVKNDPHYAYLAIVNYFKPEELDLSAVADALQFWSRYGKKLIFFTGRPEFTFYRETLVKRRIPKADFAIADLSRRKELIDLLASKDVHVVDSEKLFCSIAEGCSFKNFAEDLLLIDGSHFSKIGARAFGKALLSSDPLFEQWK